MSPDQNEAKNHRLYMVGVSILLRIFLVFLILFELLNAVWILWFTLDYSWWGLVYTDMFGFVSAEVLMRLQRNVNPLLIVFPIAFAISLDAFGDIAHLYAIIPHYDKLLHFLNSGVVTYLIFSSLCGTMSGRGRYRSRLHALVAASIGIALGTIYEIGEFLEDEFVNRRRLRFGDSFDTGVDLLMNVLGCIAVASAMYLWSTRRKKKE